VNLKKITPSFLFLVYTYHMKISESFYSIQGEGITVGMPSIFLRLTGCNLTCGGINTLTTKKKDSGATWRCDTIEVWRKGTEISIKELLITWQKNGWLSALKNGTHLVITGGEPLIQESEIIALIRSIESLNQAPPFVEVETNGTLLPSEELSERVSQWNVSPKLRNSGMAYEHRIVTQPLAWFGRRNNTWFKFVASHPEDIQEALDTVIHPLHISLSKVIIMPGVDSRNDHLRYCSAIISRCKQESLRFSPRLHILLWDKTTGI
jgi:7-carboxy-7-deazaguanine synthase